MTKITKPNPDFPLTPHYGSGQWVKKIRGKSHYFGKLEDWRAALNTYLDERDDLLAAGTRSRQNIVTVADLTRDFLESKRRSLIRARFRNGPTRNTKSPAAGSRKPSATGALCPTCIPKTS